MASLQMRFGRLQVHDAAQHGPGLGHALAQALQPAQLVGRLK